MLFSFPDSPVQSGTHYNVLMLQSSSHWMSPCPGLSPYKYKTSQQQIPLWVLSPENVQNNSSPTCVPSKYICPKLVQQFYFNVLSVLRTQASSWEREKRSVSGIKLCGNQLVGMLNIICGMNFDTGNVTSLKH